MWEHGETVEISGTLVDLGTKFFKEGWGYAQIKTTRGTYKITGALEGRHNGDLIEVKGVWDQRSKYGPQLACSYIAVKRLASTPLALRTWLKKMGFFSQEQVDCVVEAVCGFGSEAGRWQVLASEAALCSLGVPVDIAAVVAEAATRRLVYLKKVEELLIWGFTNEEIKKINEDHLLKIVSAVEVYGLVPAGLSFHRADAISRRFDVETLAAPRVGAAAKQALHEAEKKGSTAMLSRPFRVATAEQLGVYPTALEGAKFNPVELGVKKQGECIQNTEMVMAEQNTADLILIILGELEDATDDVISFTAR